MHSIKLLCISLLLAVCGWGQIGNGGGGVCGTTTQIQFNNAGVCGASTNLTWNNATDTLAVGTSVSITSQTGSLLQWQANAYNPGTPGFQIGDETLLPPFLQGYVGSISLISDTVGYPFGIQFTQGDGVTEAGMGHNIRGYTAELFQDRANARLEGSHMRLNSHGFTDDSTGFAWAYYAQADTGGGGSFGDVYYYFGTNLAGVAINPYYEWFDSQGVRRVREDATFDSVGQAIEALYNPQFAKYTPGAVNFERCVPGGQWNGNVCEFGTEKGGTGTLRPVRMLGPSFEAVSYKTATNCSNAASPAVCGSAAAGAVAVPTGITSVVLVVNTTAVTANSQITLTSDDSLTIAATTCNSTLATLVGGLAVTARTAGTSFTITYNGTIATNPLCVSYSIVN